MMRNIRLLALAGKARWHLLACIGLQWLGLLGALLGTGGLALEANALLQGRFALHALGLLALGLALRFVAVLGDGRVRRALCHGIKHSLRQQLFAKLLRLGVQGASEPDANHLQLACEGVEQLELYFGRYLPQLGFCLLAPITLFAALLFVSPRAAVALLLCVPLIPLLLAALQRIARRHMRRYWGDYLGLGEQFLENVTGLTTLKIYQADERRHQEMNQVAESFRKRTMRVLRMQLNSILLMDAIAFGGAALGIAAAVVDLQQGASSLAGCLFAVLLAAEFFVPLRQLGSSFHMAMNGLSAADSLQALLGRPEPDATKPEALPFDSMELHDLQFGYSTDRPVLHGVNMEFKARQCTAIVGPSGCGKSTVAALLAGWQQNYTGSVRLGQQEQNSLAAHSLARHVVVLGHRPVLFAGTVEHNLRLAKPDATTEELHQVLHQVRLQTEVQLNTELLEGAANLSGGQKQRLAIARALLLRAAVYIFDEATANIDPESEDAIMDLLYALKKEHTVVLITHRLHNVQRADHIYHLQKNT